jgi:two-component system chemotaxis response regulator CheY
MVVIVRNILRQVGVSDVLDARDGSRALDVMAEARVDFILSEWDLEPMTGLQLLREVRSRKSTMGIPFMFMTSHADETKIMAARSARVSGFIVKPFSAEALQKRMVRILGVS